MGLIDKLLIGKQFDKTMRLLKERLAAQSQTPRMNPYPAGVLERIRDYTPLTYEVMRPEQLASQAIRATETNSGERLISTTPAQYRKLAARLEDKQGELPRSSQEQVAALRDILAARESRLTPLGNEYYTNEFPEFEGWGDIPFLGYGGPGKEGSEGWNRIAGHEGRHRMRAIGELYGEDAPVTVRAMGDSFYLPQEIKKPFSIDQNNRNRPVDEQKSLIINAPRPWKDGGAVPYADGGLAALKPQKFAGGGIVGVGMDLAKAVMGAEKAIPAAKKAISIQPILSETTKTPSLSSLASAFQTALTNHHALPPELKAENSAKAAAAIAEFMGGANKPLLNKNVKLMKANLGYNLDKKDVLQFDDGRGVETTGLALSPALRTGTFTTCPNAESCKGTCLGKTAGNYFQLGGGNDMEAMLGPRLSSYNRTRALLNDPESFAVRLSDEIAAARAKAEEQGNHLGVRLNVLSDIHPKVYKSLIEAHPEVGFYDYTKNLNAMPVAGNHHLTYSSTGVSHPELGVENQHQNWSQIRKILERGDNAAMSFSNKLHMPESVLDQETGKTYRVINGDLHDFRPIDEKGVIVGLKNKAANTTHKNAVQNSGGFLVHYDPQIPTDELGRQVKDPVTGRAVPGNTQVTIPSQEMKTTVNTNDGDVAEFAKGGLVGDDEDYQLSLPSRNEANTIEANVYQQHAAHLAEKQNDSEFHHLGFAKGGKVTPAPTIFKNSKNTNPIKKLDNPITTAKPQGSNFAGQLRNVLGLAEGGEVKSFASQLREAIGA